MAQIQKLAQLANTTFAHVNQMDRKVFSDNLNKLISASSLIKKSDVGLIPEYLSQSRLWEESESFENEPPVTYIDIFKNDVFTLGIFIIKHGARIPLHDHPGMHGIVKVLHGRVLVQSYTRVNEREKSAADHEVMGGAPFLVRKNPEVVVSESDGPSLLTPSDSNLHEIKAEAGIAAFLDVLAPPYDSARDCHYYKELEPSDAKSSDVYVVEINPPNTYWSNCQPYLGPSIDI